MDMQTAFDKYEKPCGGCRRKAKSAPEIINEAWSRVVALLDERAACASTSPQVRREMRAAARAVRIALLGEKPIEHMAGERLKEGFKHFERVAQEVAEELLGDLEYMARLIAAGHPLKKRLSPIRGRLYEAVHFMTANVARLKAQSVEFAKLLEGQKGEIEGSKGH
jgi:hypothetical protein